MRFLQRILWLFIAIVFVMSCGNNSSGPDLDSETEATSGTVEITTSTRGNDQDQDGYMVTLGENEEDISLNETISIDGLDEGSYNTELSNIAGNCSVNKDNPRTVTVTAGETTSTTFEINCQKIEPVSEQEAKDAVLQVMRDKGWEMSSKSATTNPSSSLTESNDPSLLDYLTMDVNDSGARGVYLFIGPDGQIIPNKEWQENNQDMCQNQELRYMKVPVKRFNLEMFSLADGYDVFAQYIDIETGEIEAQREGQSASLVDAISSAWDKIQKPVKKPESPCGDKVDSISLHFNSSTTFENYIKDAGNTDIFIEEVKATVELTYHSEDSMYVGSGDLSWEKFDHSIGDCELPGDATIKVHKFVYDDPTAADGIELQIQFLNWKRATCIYPGEKDDFEGIPRFSLSWWVLHENEVHEKHESNDTVLTVEYIYKLNDLNAVLFNEQIIAVKTYNQGTTKESDHSYDTFYEDTMIEIRRNSDSNGQ